MTKFIFKLKKPLFLAHSPNLCGKKKKFPKKSGSATQLDKAFYYHAKIQRNLMIQFQEKTQTDSMTEG